MSKETRCKQTERLKYSQPKLAQGPENAPELANPEGDAHFLNIYSPICHGRDVKQKLSLEIRRIEIRTKEGFNKLYLSTKDENISS